MAGVTLDSGALIGFERQNRRTLTHIKLAQELGHELTVPTPVIVEAWRAGPRSARIAALLDACVIELLFPHLARLAGEANSTVPKKPTGGSEGVSIRGSKGGPAANSETGKLLGERSECHRDR